MKTQRHECIAQNNYEPEYKEQEIPEQKEIQVLEEKTKPCLDSKFADFLEANIESVISCPISGSTFFNPVTCSDGFSYEGSVMDVLMSKTNSPKSPMTRELLTKTHHKNNLIAELINYADKYDLEASKNKFINSDSFEENAEIILNNISKCNYENIYKFKNFMLSFGEGNSLFCKKMLTCNINNSDEYIKCIVYILENSNDKDFMDTSSNNILHIFFKYCQEMKLIEYLFSSLPTEKMQTMMSVLNNEGNMPIDESFHNKTPVFNYIIENGGGANVSINLINTCISKKVNDEVIIKLLEQIEDVNVFDDRNMSPMFYAISASNVIIIDYLISKNYNMELKSPAVLNAFHFAAKCRGCTVIEYIMDMCTNFDEPSVDNWRIIHMCAYYNNFDSIMFLLEKFINVTIPITKFKDTNVEYLPMNLIELNGNLKDEERHSLIEYCIQLWELQNY